MTIRIVTIFLLLALGSCAKTVNADKGYITYSTFAVRVGSPTKGLLPGRSWRFLNKTQYTKGTIFSLVKSTKIASTEKPETIFSAKRPSILLEFSHKETNGRILYTILDIPPAQSSLKLDILLDRFMSAITGGHTFFSFNAPTSLFHSKRLVATVKEKSGGTNSTSTLRATIEVRDSDVIRVKPNQVERVVKVVLQRIKYKGVKMELTDPWGKPTASADMTFNALSIALYVERPQFLSTTQQDFDNFLTKISRVPINRKINLSDFHVE